MLQLLLRLLFRSKLLLLSLLLLLPLMTTGPLSILVVVEVVTLTSCKDGLAAPAAVRRTCCCCRWAWLVALEGWYISMDGEEDEIGDEEVEDRSPLPVKFLEADTTLWKAEFLLTPIPLAATPPPPLLFTLTPDELLLAIRTRSGRGGGARAGPSRWPPAATIPDEEDPVEEVAELDRTADILRLWWSLPAKSSSYHLRRRRRSSSLFRTRSFLEDNPTDDDQGS